MDLIKMDVEGYEKPALRGLSKTLERDRPIVFLELTKELKQGFQGKEDFLAAFPASYEFVVVQRLHPRAKGKYRLKPFDFKFHGKPKQHNMVAFPSEKKALVPTTNCRPRECK